MYQPLPPPGPEKNRWCRCYCARFMLRWKRADFDYRQYQRHIKELGLQQGEDRSPLMVPVP